ncbi:MAG: HD domain-containing protein [Syntrophales bacterium]
MEQMPNQEYLGAMALAREISAEVGEPLFYRERTLERTLSEEFFSSEPLVQDILQIIEARGDYLGHGLIHVRKVAIDAGALILAESDEGISATAVRRMVLLGHLAGLLHDICRREKNHAERGAAEAVKVLTGFPLSDQERLSIAGAIQNHEAFRPLITSDSPEAQLLSDSLYDADKFRWGPDNFTETIWAMTAPHAIPLCELLPKFPAGMQGVEKIKESFRTATGRRYGPDFIERGLEIGRRLYAILTTDC